MDEDTTAGTGVVAEAVAKARAELELQHERSLAAIQSELRQLRASQAALRQEAEAHLRDKDWLKRERDAVAETYNRQQACLQDQLRVVNTLRASLDVAAAERSKLIKEHVEAFEEIRASILEEKDSHHEH